MADVLNLVPADTCTELTWLPKADSRKVIITKIFEFAKVTEPLNYRYNIILMVDEAYRTKEIDLGVRMREALPNAFFFSLTGTHKEPHILDDSLHGHADTAHAHGIFNPVDGRLVIIADAAYCPIYFLDDADLLIIAKGIGRQSIEALFFITKSEGITTSVAANLPQSKSVHRVRIIS